MAREIARESLLPVAQEPRAEPGHCKRLLEPQVLHCREKMRTELDEGRRNAESNVPLAVAAAAAIAACFEGLILHNIARHDGADPRPTFDLVLRAALG